VISNLLAPNLLYLLLVSFFFLASIAILTPGAGILELAGLLTLIAAVWGIVSLPLNYGILLVLILGTFPMVVAARLTGKRFFIYLSAICLTSGSILIFPGEYWYRPAINPILVGSVSVSLGLLFVFSAQSFLDKTLQTSPHQLDTLIGAHGEAYSSFSGEMEGTIKIQGKYWSARSADHIKKGEPIQIIDRVGSLLVVVPLKDS
jgi:membrane-bound serine protease (ClpP class)